MGMWHGANWTFLYWGLFHASWILGYRTISKYTRTLPKMVRVYGGWGVTLLLAMASWIPFRAKDVVTTLAMHLKILLPWEYVRLGLRENTYIFAALVLLGMVIYFVSSWIAARGLVPRSLIFIVATISYAVQFASVFIFLRPIKQFIYFQF